MVPPSTSTSCVLGKLLIVTVPAIVCVPVGLAVTVPAIVTVLPMVTDEMDIGTVPLMLAVTLPICAVPAVSRVLVNSFPDPSSTDRN